ncbi:hypothetical protein FN846DRAFT_398632 [Sphaerosporella brunnea]|uniref:Uncharacterized protein n=1 Tax=Sphaerosporella brunnea TaxID=1250544 RepID=A0A5J5EJ01_9PEZI|nr:hypothetical protein FN846DRAFT_398632 [Sphaerosporella brunnea]
MADIAPAATGFLIVSMLLSVERNDSYGANTIGVEVCIAAFIFFRATKSFRCISLLFKCPGGCGSRGKELRLGRCLIVSPFSCTESLSLLFFFFCLNFGSSMGGEDGGVRMKTGALACLCWIGGSGIHIAMATVLLNSQFSCI